MTDYTTGTITLTSGSTAFTTSGAALVSAAIRPGDAILRNGRFLVIASITGENQGTLAEACPADAAGTGVALRIRFQSDISRFSVKQAQLIASLSGGNAQSLAALDGSGGNKGIHFAGSGSLATHVQTAAARAFADIGDLPVADRLAYLTSDSAAALAPFTAAARALVHLTGTAEANRVPYLTSAGAAALTPLPAVGRALINPTGTPAADRLPYLTGAAEAALTPLPAVGRALINPTGTPAADRLPYLTGAAEAALTPLTPVARTLLEQTSQANMRSTGLGLGTAAIRNTGGSGANVVPVFDVNWTTTGQIILNKTGAGFEHTDGTVTGRTLMFGTAFWFGTISAHNMNFFVANGNAAMTVVQGTNAVHFPLSGTTASAANAFLDSSSTPANRLLRSTSSLNYKRDIEDLEAERADAFIEQARPVWYRSKAEPDNPNWGWYGLIAEELAAIDPRLVHWGYQEHQYETFEVEFEDEEGDSQTRTDVRLKEGEQKVPDGVQYDRLTVLLLDVVKRQREAIADLTGRVAALEAETVSPGG